MAVSVPLVNQVDYLTLLTAQLKYQNPLDPLNNADFLGQMAQFSNLQQAIDLNTKFDAFAKGFEYFQGSFVQNLQTQSLMLLNRQVDFKDPITGASLSGFVDKIKFVDGVPKISVVLSGGTSEIALGDITTVYATAYAPV